MPENLAPTVLRHLSADESPMPGLLVRGERLRVRTDAALWNDNPAWRADANGHVLAPLEAGRDGGGCAVFVAHCPARLLPLLEQRTHLDPGEAVTVAVSVLRGAAEATALGIESGTWWVTDEGRPVVAGGGYAHWREEARDILARVRELTRGDMQAALSVAHDALDDPRRLTRDQDAFETALFDTADPCALETELVSVRARAVSVAAREATPETPATGTAVLHEFVTRHIDARWADHVSDAWHRVARWVRERPAVGRPRDAPGRRPRRRALVLGAAAGALVLLVGLSWPDDAPEQVAAAAQPTATPAAGSPDESPAEAAEAAPSSDRAQPPGIPTPDARAPSDHDAAKSALTTSVAEALIERFAACEDDGCRGALIEDPASPIPQGPATEPGADPSVRIIDDYGGVAALSVASQGRTQIVVIVRVEDEWLVRDIHDVADQP